jgi:hypothetical protein
VSCCFYVHVCGGGTTNTGETYDARLAPPASVFLPGFNATAPAWLPAIWAAVQPNAATGPKVPVSDWWLFFLCVFLSLGCYVCIPHTCKCKNAHAHAHAHAHAQMVPAAFEPVRRVERREVVAITNPKAGVYVFDFGVNSAGRCRLQGGRYTKKPFAGGPSPLACVYRSSARLFFPIY